MAATMSIYLDTGGSDATPGFETDVDALSPNLRFKVADNSVIDTANPIPIPAAGTNYSYWKSVYLFCDNADSHTMDNLKFYSDGSNTFGTGVGLVVGEQFPVKNSGSDAGYEVADTAAELSANHSGISSVVDVFTKSSGSPLSGPTISESGSAIDAANETSNYLVFQMTVADTASPGELPVDETLTIQYDEA